MEKRTIEIIQSPFIDFDFLLKLKELFVNDPNIIITSSDCNNYILYKYLEFLDGKITSEEFIILYRNTLDDYYNYKSIQQLWAFYSSYSDDNFWPLFKSNQFLFKNLAQTIFSISLSSGQEEKVLKYCYQIIKRTS